MMTERTIEQELDLRGYGLFQTVGDSMEPLLHNRKSTVVIKKKTGPLKRYDVALYRRPHKKEYVLHRVVRVLEDGYLIRGDNRIWREKVPEEWVVGVMAGCFETEENRYVSCECRIYRKYLKSLKKRYWMRWTAKLPSRIWKRLTRQNKKSDTG